MAGRGHVAGDRSGMLTRTRAGRVAIWVAVQRRAASYTEGRASTLVQPEPIRTTAPRAANAAHRPQVRSEEAEAHGVRSACDSGWRTTVTHGQLRSSDGCGHGSAR